jgi:ech hydrogenase subunit A
VVIVGFLITLPLLAALLLLVVRNDRVRAPLVIGAGSLTMLGSLALAVLYLFSPGIYVKIPAPYSEIISYATVAVSCICCLYVLVKGARNSKPLAVFLAALQLVFVLILEFGAAHDVEVKNDLYIDQLSVIMALVIGIIGSGICIYAVGYMRDFQHHLEQHAATHHHARLDSGYQALEHHAKDRRHIFFALMFVFLSAMYMIVFSNNLTWLLCGWEVTTVCSFALIGYTRTREAIDNSFRQIVMNLIGGLGFVMALMLLSSHDIKILELDRLIAFGSLNGGIGLVGLPVLLLSLAGFTKAAQMPFQSWLLGAMVAPTPTSALLHSSTKVKAGVFILIKLAPVFAFNLNGLVVILVGGLTFFFCSALAISQSNAKRVLAYSTVANLGLIVACAGVGTPEAVWAAIFLLIFHAAAKSLLFCCVGTAEHHIASRDIEDMDAIFTRLPRLALLMALGMFCMFIAPFGMLISKWATIVTMVDTGNIPLLFLLAFGSALTFVFWAKWLGKVLAVAQGGSNTEHHIHKSEWFALGLMSLLAVGLAIGLPWVSEGVVVPYLSAVASGFSGDVSSWAEITISTYSLPGAIVGENSNLRAAIGFNDLLIMATIALALIIVFAIKFLRRPKEPTSSIYLGGVGIDSSKRSFINALSTTSVSTQRNWYMESLFGEKVMTSFANVLVIAVMVLGAIAIYVGFGGVL